MSQFFYDKQIRRFLEQFVRYFSYFEVEYGQDRQGNKVLYRVPCRYADTNRNVSSILKQNSDNAMNNVPMIVVYLDNIRYDRDRVQDPRFIDKKSFRTSIPNQGSGTGAQQGQAFTLERLMPVPYRLTVKIELWTSNFDQKLQLFEQILPQFNPDMEIQNTDNYLDWTSLSYILLTDVAWTTRNIPVGTDDPIDVGAMTFEVPIWLSLPSKLKKLGVVLQVITTIYDAMGNPSQALVDQSDQLGNRQYFTPMGYQLVLLDGVVTLAARYGPVANAAGLDPTSSLAGKIDWHVVISLFGEIVDGVSMLYLTDLQTENLIVGTVAYDPVDRSRLYFNIDPDTIPQDSLQPVLSIVDPTSMAPGNGLIGAAEGQRYLLVKGIGNTDNDPADQSSKWSGGNVNLVANANDILEYRNSTWQIVFDSTAINTVQYVSNLTTNIQYKWTGTQWVKSYDGLYTEGAWSIVI